MATGALNAQGVWIYGEDDSETTFSALLNKLGNSVSSNMKGRIVQIQHYRYGTTVYNNTNSRVDTGLTGTITPTSTNSKILILVDQNGVSKEQDNTGTNLYLMRNSTDILTLAWAAGQNGNTALSSVGTAGATYFDAPATTSLITYKTQQVRSYSGGYSTTQYGGATSTLTLIEVTQ